jgi:hypothetical protein
VNLAAQTFAGIKTFTSAIVASAGIQVASLFNTNGTGSSDVGVKVGVSTADGSVNATAHILSARTGIGGTEVEKFWVNKLGAAIAINTRLELNGDGGGVFVTYRSADGMAGFSNGAAGYLGIFPGTGASGCSGLFTAAGGIETNSSTGYVAATLFQSYFGGGTVLRGSNGGSASDIAVKTGTQTADASVNVGAKLLSIRTGLGGTEVERAYWLKAGTDGFSLRNTASGGVLTMESSAGTSIGWNGVSGTGYDSNNAITFGAVSAWLRSNAADGASAVAAYSHAAAGWANATAKLHVFRNGSTEVASVSASGRVDQSGTDSSGTPGAATINKPTGVSAIASGSATVVITNSLATTTSRILITWHGDHGQTRDWVVRAAGSFTVTLNAAASANTAFSWEVSTII